MFKNSEAKLNKYLDKHSKGEVAIPSELEQIMIEESSTIIKRMYDNKYGAEQLYMLIKLKKGKLLKATNMDKKVKLD